MFHSAADFTFPVHTWNLLLWLLFSSQWNWFESVISLEVLAHASLSSVFIFNLCYEKRKFGVDLSEQDSAKSLQAAMLIREMHLIQQIEESCLEWRWEWQLWLEGSPVKEMKSPWWWAVNMHSQRQCHRSVWHLPCTGSSSKNSLPAQLEKISLVFNSDFD